MTTDVWVNILIGVIAIVVPVIFGLMSILYKSQKDRMDSQDKRVDRLEDRIEGRFRSFGHQFREIQSQLQGVLQLFLGGKEKK